MKNDRLLGALVLISGIILFPATLGFPGAASNRPGPAFLPRVLGVLFGICGLLLIFGRATQKEEATSVALGAWMKVLAVIIGLVFYVGVVNHVGYIIATSILTASLFILLGNSILISAVATLILVLGTYALFSTVLGVVLPVGWLGW
jgi:hypothetical protein